MGNKLLRPQRRELPHAQPTEVSAPFWESCAEGVLAFQRCTACRAISFPPVEICRDCLRADLSWESSTGRGTLRSWTVVYRPVTPAFDVPYAPAIVELNEGYQMVTNLIGIAPESITPNMPVEVEFHEVGPELRLPYFRPSSI
jgi:uncharacterized OB-fold protein